MAATYAHVAHRDVLTDVRGHHYKATKRPTVATQGR